MRLVSALILGLVLGGASLAAATADSGPTWLPPPAGVEHRGEWVANGSDIRGPRNFQGGYRSTDPRSLNLDISAGSAEHPGDLVLNYDNGKRVLIYDGRKRLVAEFGRRRPGAPAR